MGAVSAFGFNRTPLSNASPFTYREGATYLSILHGIVDFINEKQVPELNGILDKIVTVLESHITFVNLKLAESQAGIDATEDEWLEKFDQFMIDVTAEISLLNDDAIASLLMNSLTDTRSALESILNKYAYFVSSTTFYVNPASGVDTNSGDLVAPLKTINEAFSRISRVVQGENAKFTVNLAAGVYSERVRPLEFTPFSYSLTIQGPEVGHPVTPLSIFTEGEGAVAVAMFFTNPNAAVTVKNVKFVGYNGSASSCGINSNEGVLNTINVHADRCYYGISGSHGILDVKGGIIENCGILTGDTTGNGAGIRSLFQNHHSIGRQSAGTNSEGPFFYNNSTGIFAQESSTGHADWCTFEENVNAIQLNINSRVNADGCTFRRNSNDFNARGNSNFNIPASVSFGTGSNASGQVALIAGGSQAPTAKALDVDMSYGRTEQAFWANYNSQIVTGTTSTVNVATRTLVAPWWGGVIPVGGTTSKKLKVRVVGSIAGVAGIKRLNMRIDSLIASATLSATEVGPFVWDGEFRFISPTKQMVCSEFKRHLADSQRIGNGIGAVDMTVNRSLTVNVGLDDAGDSITIDMIEFYFA